MFIVKLYIPAWFVCESTTQAPNNDIQFLKAAKEFESIDFEISAKVLKKISGHGWYIADECVAFALFDPNVSNGVKKAMAEKLLKKQTQTLKVKKVKFPRNEIPAQPELTDFVTANTIEFFKRFGISSDFLYKDPALWDSDDNYKEAAMMLSKIKPVNNCAERGVKLMADFKNSSPNENQKQNIMQVVSKDRRENAQATKSSLRKKPK